MHSKAIYMIAAVIIIAAGGAIVLNIKSKSAGNEKAAQQTQMTDNQLKQNQENNNTAQQANAVEKGCQPGADYSKKDASGRFVPTVDLAGKIVVMETTMGVIELEIYGKDAPKTAQNFICLVERGFYNGIKFHRVAHGFVIQAGDPTGTGSGGDSIYGAKFEDELYADTASYKAGYLKGVLAMANAGANTNSSQFFIMLADNSLPHNYTIFGKVSKGQDVVDKIGIVPVDPGFGPEDGAPKTPIFINKAYLK